MDISLLVIGFLFGAAISSVIVYLFLKTKTVSKTEFNDLSVKYTDNATNLKLSDERLRTQASEVQNLSVKLLSKERDYTVLQAANITLEGIARQHETKVKELDQILTERTNINFTQQNEINHLKQENAEIKAFNDFLKEKLDTQKTEMIEIQKTAHLEFKEIANQIFQDKSDRFTETNKTNIESLLKPLGENIEGFKRKVEEVYHKESSERFSLGERIKELFEQTNRVSAEANNLATALKGQAKKQGNWGEIILESILEKSGLVKNREYKIQHPIEGEDGRRLQPDVLVYLPDNRVVIIDSKVSLVAYDKFSSTDCVDEQKTYLAEHIKSMQGHIINLHGKKYDNIDTSLDFTMMFVPIEPAYLTAIQADEELWHYAYTKRIMLISPTNLITCLKLISDLWKRELQSKNAMEIVKRGELIYEKLVTFSESMEEIGKHIDRTQLVYNTAIGQLKNGHGNLMGQATKLKSLGLKSNKVIAPTLLPVDFDNEEAESKIFEGENETEIH
jgi:DNA recombination protein RmuC